MIVPFTKENIVLLPAIIEAYDQGLSCLESYYSERVFNQMVDSRQEDYFKKLVEEEHKHLFLYMKNNAIAGVLETDTRHISPTIRTPAQGKGYINYIFSLEQQKHIGSQLIAYFIDFLPGSVDDVTSISARVNKSNVVAQQFFTKQQFKPEEIPGIRNELLFKYTY